MATYSQPTVLWRLSGPRGCIAEAVVVPRWGNCALVLNCNQAVRSARDYQSWEQALRRADKVRNSLLRRWGWAHAPESI